MKPAFIHLKFGPEGVTAKGDPSYYHGNAVTMSDGSRNGVYSEWDWDGTTLRAGNCRYGMSPLFYYCGDNEICLSNSIPKMLDLGVPQDWDDDAMAVFIRRHTFLGEDTPFKHIRATPPGAKLTWRNGRMDLEGKRFEPKPQHLKRSAIVDGVIELFQQAIARRLPDTEDFYLPLTGGKDSRHILLELHRQGVRPKACVTARKTASPSDNDDCAIAAQLTERLGIPHIILPPSKSIVADEQRKNLRTNFCTIDHGWSMPLVDFLEANTSLSYDGLGLDVFFNTIWYSDLRANLFHTRDFQELGRDLLGESDTALSLTLSSEALRRFDRNNALDHLAKELKLHLNSPHPIASFQFWNRTRRTTSIFTFGLQYTIPNIHTPFLDNNLFDFVTSLPADELRAAPLHPEVLTRAYKDFCDIDYQIQNNKSKSKYTRLKSSQLIKLFSSNKNIAKTTNKKKNNKILFYIAKSLLTGNEDDLNWIKPDLLLFTKQIEEKLVNSMCTR